MTATATETDGILRINRGRGEGKTTALLEWAVEQIAEDHDVVIVGHHSARVRAIAESMHGLVGCRFIEAKRATSQLRGIAPDVLVGVDDVDLCPEDFVMDLLLIGVNVAAITRTTHGFRPLW